MDRRLNLYISNVYHNKSQITRIVTERWGADNLYCPICGFDRISAYPNNEKVSDFFCQGCRENYQLKSTSKKLGKSFPGSEYYTLVNRIENEQQPNLFLLQYDLTDEVVKKLIFIPRVFFSTSVIELRKPLSKTARRAGWTGCNIRLDRIPAEGKILLITPDNINTKQAVQNEVKKIRSLFNTEKTDRQWYIEILKIVRLLPDRFQTMDIYKYEDYLKRVFPNNNNVKAKIRQQLQVLRDNGIIVFSGAGVYEKLTYSFLDESGAAGGKTDVCRHTYSKPGKQP